MSYRIIQTGLGDFGQRWLDVVRTNESWQYAAIATRTTETRNACGEKAGIPKQYRFATLAEALGSDVDADVLLVTTPHLRHTDDVTAGLERGLHVLVEKPLAGSWQECLRIREAARNANTRVMVAENYRYGAGARTARDIVASGEIGTPEFLCVEYFVGHTFPEGDWRNEYTYPLLVENATHHFDLVRYVTATDAERVYATAFGSQRTPQWEAPSVTASFTMSGGFQFQFGASWAYQELQTPWEGRWRLHGSEGTLLWTTDRIEVHRGRDVRVVELPSRPSDHTLAATLAEFTAALDDHRPPETALADNMQTVAMVYGAIRSSEQGVPVSIPEMLAE